MKITERDKRIIAINGSIGFVLGLIASLVERML